MRHDKIASNWYNKGVKFLAQKQVISRRGKTLISLYTCPRRYPVKGGFNSKKDGVSPSFFTLCISEIGRCFAQKILKYLAKGVPASSIGWSWAFLLLGDGSSSECPLLTRAFLRVNSPCFRGSMRWRYMPLCRGVGVTYIGQRVNLYRSACKAI